MGHTVPVDGRLVAHDGVFTTAWINGESAPRLFHEGQRIPAGAMNVTRGEARLEALQTWSESLLAKLLQGEVRPGFRHRRFERIIQGYLAGIIGLALAAGLAWAVASGDAHRALAVALSVLVVSCPCAIGLALPLADEMAVTALRRAGVFVRENDLWARLGRVRKIIFDKTGTLTLESPDWPTRRSWRRSPRPTRARSWPSSATIPTRSAWACMRRSCWAGPAVEPAPDPRLSRRRPMCMKK